MKKRLKLLQFYHNSKECKGVVMVSLIYLVEGFEIWFEGLCSECGAHVRVSNQIEQLIMMTPNPNNRPFWKPPTKKEALTKEDIDFLKDLGIGGDDEEKKKIN